MKLNGAAILIECLIEQGVGTVFGFPGGAVLPIYDELYKRQDRIRHVLTAHEQHAGHAADGYARASGKTGVCIATSGPGATNLVTPIATAYMDSTPIVFITGNVPQSLMGTDSFQEADISGMTMPVTKHNYLVTRVEKLADIVREATRLEVDLSMTWSCYDPTPDGRPCGGCDSCRLRAKGFEEAGLVDPAL